MNRWGFLASVSLACIGSIVSWSVVAMAGSGSTTSAGSYTLHPSVVGAGGTRMQGGNWTLDGTLAQADALVQNGAAGLRLEGGFWRATKGAIAGDRIFANGFN